jgi:hypothetical protein
MKSELKVEFKDAKVLKELIDKSYYEQGQQGKLMGKKSIKVNEKDDDVFYTIVKGLDRSTIKITNPNVINGNMRFLLEQDGDGYNLFPISIYCVSENDIYTFY